VPIANQNGFPYKPSNSETYTFDLKFEAIEFIFKASKNKGKSYKKIKKVISNLVNIPKLDSMSITPSGDLSITFT
jgi:hypothetical protein